MIVELAILEARDGASPGMREGLTRAREIIARSPGYLGSSFQQSIERPERFVLYIKWSTVADHTHGFRKGPLFPEWRSHWSQYLCGTPDVLHYEVFAGDE
jgi:heme-degrading monooxygenase HmoA